MRSEALVGRADELRRIAEVVEGAASGRGSALALEGAVGAGKSTLLGAARASIERRSMLLIDLIGSETETIPAWGTVERLVARVLALAGGSQEDAAQVHRHASRVAELLSADHPDLTSSEVGELVLALIGPVAAERPIAILVDQADSVDRESMLVLCYMASQLAGTSAAMILAHGPHCPSELLDVPRLQVEGLDKLHARRLLRAVAGEAVDRALADQIVAVTDGNPAAILDLARELTSSQLRGQEPLPDPLPAGRTIEQRYAARFARLRPDARMWLLVASADSSRSVTRTFEAAAQLGLPSDASDDVEAMGLVRIYSEVRFASALIASSAYYTASLAQRRRVHEALGRVARAADAGDEAARHLAAQLVVADESVAKTLESIAEHAAGTPGLDPVAMMQRAANLTPGASQRAARELRAACLALEAGHHARAAAIAEHVKAGLGCSGEDDGLRGRALMISANACLDPEQPDSLAQAPALWAAAVQRLRSATPVNQELLGEALLGWASTLLLVDHKTDGAMVSTFADQVADWNERTSPTEPYRPLLVAASTLLTEGAGTAAPFMRCALKNWIDTWEGLPPPIPAVALAHLFATLLWDPCAAETVTDLVLTDSALYRRPALIRALLALKANAEARHGLVREALRTNYEARSFGLCEQERDASLSPASLSTDGLAWPSTVVGQPDQATIDLIGWDHPQPESFALLAQAAVVASKWRHAHWEGAALRSTLLLALSASQWDEANRVSDRIVEHADPRTSWLCLPDVVEARVRGGRLVEAKTSLIRLESMQVNGESTYLAAMVARSRAMVAEEPEGDFCEAIELLAGPIHDVEQARTHLLFGEWLRLHKRSGQAVRELTMARDVLYAYACFGFADRASRGLAAAASVSIRSDDVLTVQERQVALRAAEGHTNTEIAELLFLSRHTVDYHLRKVFQKLGIRGRRELRAALAHPQHQRAG